MHCYIKFLSIALSLVLVLPGAIWSQTTAPNLEVQPPMFPNTVPGDDLIFDVLKQAETDPASLDGQTNQVGKFFLNELKKQDGKNRRIKQRNPAGPPPYQERLNTKKKEEVITWYKRTVNKELIVTGLKAERREITIYPPIFMMGKFCITTEERQTLGKEHPQFEANLKGFKPLENQGDTCLDFANIKTNKGKLGEATYLKLEQIAHKYLQKIKTDSHPTISWESSPKASLYAIYRNYRTSRIDDFDPIFVGLRSFKSTSWKDDVIDANVPFCHFVRAINKEGLEGPLSEPICTSASFFRAMIAEESSLRMTFIDSSIISEFGNFRTREQILREHQKLDGSGPKPEGSNSNTSESNGIVTPEDESPESASKEPNNPSGSENSSETLPDTEPSKSDTNK